MADWVRAGGVPINEADIDPYATLEILDKSVGRFNSGWRGMIEEAWEEGFFWDGETIRLDNDIVGMASVISLRQGFVAVRFFPRPLLLDDNVGSTFFLKERFLLEFMEDCGRSMLLSASKRCEACRGAMHKALDREKAFLNPDMQAVERGRIAFLSDKLAAMWRRVAGG